MGLLQENTDIEILNDNTISTLYVTCNNSMNVFEKIQG